MLEVSIEQALSQAAADVLEKMFFTGVMDESDELPETGEQISVRLPFTGDRRGVLMLRISTEAARALAGNFLGIDGEEGPGAAQVLEVARELANMICGDALSHVENGALSLEAPEVVAHWNPPAGSSRRSFELGNGTLTVAVGFGEGADG